VVFRALDPALSLFDKANHHNPLSLPKVSRRLPSYEAKVPYISVMTDPTTYRRGPPRAIRDCSVISILLNTGALIGFAGPRVLYAGPSAEAAPKVSALGIPLSIAF